MPLDHDNRLNAPDRSPTIKFQILPDCPQAPPSQLQELLRAARVQLGSTVATAQRAEPAKAKLQLSTRGSWTPFSE